MQRARTHYEILGVPRTATAAEIRHAYLRLIKVHHPDHGPADARNRSIAPLLNRVYEVLRDPARRAQYDASLAEPPPSARSRRAQWVERRKTDRRAASAGRGPASAGIVPSLVGLAALLAGAMLVGSGFAPSSLEPKVRRASSFALAGDGGEDLTSYPAMTEIRRTVRLARNAGTQEAIGISRECFANARLGVTGRTADLCVIFDLTFTSWRATPDQPSLPAYFAVSVMGDRHRGALRSIPHSSNTRYDRLRRDALAALVSDVRGDEVRNGSGLSNNGPRIESLK